MLGSGCAAEGTQEIADRSSFQSQRDREARGRPLREGRNSSIWISAAQDTQKKDSLVALVACASPRPCLSDCLECR